MKASILRQAGFCRVALPRSLSLSARVSIAARAAPSSAAAFVQTARGGVAQLRPFSNSLARFYSAASESSSPASDDLLPSQHGRVTKFADLASLGVHEALVRSITEGMGYETMSEVQAATVNASLDGKDIVAQAKTGTGKTLAFLVPTIQRILLKEPGLATRTKTRPRADDIRAIIVSPTRELAEQIGAEARKLVQGTGLVVQTAVGGTQKRMMLQKTRFEGCHIMVATPGRLNDLLSDPSSGISAPQLEALVLDEADRMLEVGFDEELQEILRSLPDRKDVPRQTLMFSATIPKNVVSLARKYIDPSNFEFVQTVKSNETPTHEKVPQYIVPCKGYENMYPALLELCQREIARAKADPNVLPFKAMVFLPTTAAVRLGGALFRRLAFHDSSLPNISDIHSKLDQNQRTRASEAFRRATSAIMFSSDVTARGMDFPNVSHVIQMHNPPEREQYIHRLGRTGRAGKEGQGWLIIADLELQAARQKLPGLPIQRSTDLECATVDATLEGPKPEQFDQVLAAFSRLPHELMHESYTAYLGGSTKGMDKQDVVDAINQLSKYGWGLDQPPAVPMRIKRTMARVSGLRFEDTDSSYGDRDQGGSWGGRGGGSSFGRRSGGDRFDALQSESPRRSGGSDRRGRGGGGGGYGGSRGGDRGGDRRGGGGSYGGLSSNF
ncbi:P-loop containing nucleoside triphosphate hydrolase protein [Podospora appendiculata]|uniref:ATP-dependent RNA helicase n=1 Tax=Podospora appendiculata TaxID=314037 RepID=A0AAE0X9Q7_9PEZI|nr:P-loop containing nucleoside triphosphate hydrolase protein [Podospora appendiculata]